MALFVPGEVLLVSTLRICRSLCAIKFALLRVLVKSCGVV